MAYTLFIFLWVSISLTNIYKERISTSEYLYNHFKLFLERAYSVILVILVIHMYIVVLIYLPLVFGYCTVTFE